ncbi:MAG: hypothetical protein ABEI86_07325 [Halobacteriaceae archaeon]
MPATPSEGDTISYRPSNGGTFPTGEKTRRATIEAIRDDEIIIRQLSDGFTNRISKSQIVS